MKKTVYILLFVFLSMAASLNQAVAQINGQIILDTGKITVVKVWGTHAERGFAYGYLLGAKIKNLYTKYIIPKFGSYFSMAHSFLAEGSNIRIDTAYITEAKAVISGAAAAGIDTTGMDYINLLLGNCLLDLDAFLGKGGKNIFNMGCSALMSWGDATAGTDLEGKSAITRHLDWEVNTYLNNNQVMVISLPSESDEQPWLLIGFAGQISVLSGTNNSGLSAFQHVLGVSGNPTFGQHYEPVWFSMRKALEKIDYNGDGVQNVNDMRSVLTDHPQGYAGPYIITTSAPASNVEDSLIALVAELTPVSPKFTFRTNIFPDSIPGDNLYAANSPIARNNAYGFCSRYNSMINAIGDGTGIGSEENWELLRNHSRNTGYNIQHMQVLPEDRVLKLSVYKNSRCAYLNDPIIFSLDSLFAPSRNIGITENDHPLLIVYPNPCRKQVYVSVQFIGASMVTLSDISGKEVRRYSLKDAAVLNINTEGISQGIYTLCVSNKSATVKRKLVIQP